MINMITPRLKLIIIKHHSTHFPTTTFKVPKKAVQSRTKPFQATAPVGHGKITLIYVLKNLQ